MPVNWILRKGLRRISRTQQPPSRPEQNDNDGILDRMTTTTASRLVYFIALCISFALAAGTILAFLVIGPSPTPTYVAPPALCAVASFVFAFIWPAGSWRWGIWLSAGFWCFFLIVFGAYLLTGAVDWLTPVRAASVLVAGAVGAWGGASLRHEPATGA
jgi:hypothetical protein